ncbi:MAG: SurA N-terminal domain-containing protein [Chitinophagaceae bacterium]
MSVIQKIQEKYAKLMAIIIALALIIFVVMLAFENGGSLFRGSNSNDIGKVNGKSISYNEFEQSVAQQEKNIQSQGYGAQGEALRQQAIEQAWNQQVSLLLLTSEFDKLGLKVGKKELGDVLYGKGAPEDFKRSFTDTATGFFNAQAAKQRIDQMLKGNVEERAQVNSYINSLEASRLNEKYNSLLTNSSNTPKWMIEKQNADNGQLARISFVREVYSTVADSTVKISDKEIEDYISTHKKDFPQEESRSMPMYHLAHCQQRPTASNQKTNCLNKSQHWTARKM